MLAAATVARLVYGLAVADPGSGPDAPTYHEAARALAHTGFFSPAPTIPYWPVGYPAFLGIFYRAFGDDSRAFVVAQVLLLAVGTWSAYRLVRAILGQRVAVVSAVALCLSPAISGAVVLRMYEIPLLAGLAIGADLLWTGAHAQGRQRLALLGGAGLLLGLASMMQPKVLLPIGLMVVLAIWWIPEAPRRRAALIALSLVALAVGPSLMVIRNVHVGDGVGLSANLGATMLVGAGYASHTIIECKPRDHTFAGDQEMVRCVLKYKLHHPPEAVEVGAYNELALWSPMVGPLRYRGSWFHAFDPRRPLPADVKYDPQFLRVDKVVSEGWILLTVGLVLFGLVTAVRSSATRRDALWLSIPVLAFVLMHAVIAGDPRFRLPVSPFYTAFIGVAVVSLADRLQQRRARRTEPR